MDEKNLLSELEILARRLGMTIRYEAIKIDGGLHPGGYCRVRGQEMILISRKATVQDKIAVLVEALRRRDLQDLYLLPILRKAIEDAASKEVAADPPLSELDDP